jgi:type II secretory pathway pseudopilin PulG
MNRIRFDALAIVMLVVSLGTWVGTNLSIAAERSRQKRTMSNVRSVAVALESYATDTNAYPRVRSIDELASILEPKYVKQLPRVDGWGMPLVYEAAACDRGPCHRYYVASGGENRIVDEKTLTAYGSGKHASAMTSDDIVMTEGNFLNGDGVV